MILFWYYSIEQLFFLYIRSCYTWSNRINHSYSYVEHVFYFVIDGRRIPRKLEIRNKRSQKTIAIYPGNMRLEYEITKDEDNMYLVVHPKLMLFFKCLLIKGKKKRKEEIWYEKLMTICKTHLLLMIGRKSIDLQNFILPQKVSFIQIFWSTWLLI